MNLEQEWQNMSAEISTKTTYPTYLESSKPQSLLNDVYFKLKWKLRWLRIIDVPILAAALIFRGDLQLVLIAVFLTYEITRYSMMKQLVKIKGVIDYSLNTKKVLEENLAALTKILRIENIFGYLFLPLSAPIGVLITQLYLHQNFQNVFNLPNFIYQISLTLLIGIAMIFLAKKMNNFIFKQPIIDLKSKIEQLENK